MITKESFFIQIKALLEYRKNKDEQLEHLYKAFPDASCMIDEVSEKLFDKYVSFLSEQCDDENDWISYYVFDNECGKKKLSVEIGKKKIKLDSIEKLWNIISKK